MRKVEDENCEDNVNQTPVTIFDILGFLTTGSNITRTRFLSNLGEFQKSFPLVDQGVPIVDLLKRTVRIIFPPLLVRRPPVTDCRGGLTENRRKTTGGENQRRQPTVSLEPVLSEDIKKMRLFLSQRTKYFPQFDFDQIVNIY